MARPDKKQSALEALQRRLYARGEKTAPHKRSGFRTSREEDASVASDWEHTHPVPERRSLSETRKRTLAHRFLIMSIIFFVVASGVAAFIILGGENIISSSNIDISTTGPSTLSGGDTLELGVAITNRNNVALESVDLIVEFPSSARNPEDVSQPQETVRTSLGAIEPGERVQESVAAIVFGADGDVQEVLITLEYRVRGSNAIFAKERLYEYEIGAAPLSLRVELPDEINSGQEVPIAITITSNATEVIQNVVLSATYPFGFTLSNADPEPSAGDTTWRLGDMAPETTKTIELVGILEGQDEEERTFHFSAGIEDTEVTGELGVVFLTEQQTVRIARPFIALSLLVNGKAGETFVAQSGAEGTIDISWQNNLSAPIANAEISASITGSGLIEDSIRALNGFYDSQTNTVTWDWRTLPALRRINPGEGGQVSFDFTAIDLSGGASANEPTISLDAHMEGEREDASGVSGNIAADRSARISVATEFLLSHRAVYSIGSFENDGPLPPEAEEATTYTIVWTVTNAVNSVSDAVVTAALPPYVRWLGETSPGTETITYDEVSRRVSWQVGAVEAGVGYESSPRQASFQIELVPSTSQIDTAPILVGSAELSGIDDFTNTTVGDTRPAVTTQISTDPDFSSGMGEVTD